MLDIFTGRLFIIRKNLSEPGCPPHRVPGPAQPLVLRLQAEVARELEVVGGDASHRPPEYGQ